MFSASVEVGREDRRGDAEREVRVLLRPAPAWPRWSCDALSKPFLTSRTWLCTSPMPSSETRMLIRIPLGGAELDDPREHRDRAVRRQPGRVDADLAQPRQVPVEQLDHLRQVVPRRRLAAGDVQVLDGAPERVVEAPARAARASCPTCGRPISSCCTSCSGRRRPRCSCRSAPWAGSGALDGDNVLTRSRGTPAAAFAR